LGTLDLFGLVDLPRWARVTLAQQHLTAIRVGEELPLRCNRRGEARHDLLADLDDARVRTRQADVAAMRFRGLAAVAALAVPRLRPVNHRRAALVLLRLARPVRVAIASLAPRNTRVLVFRRVGVCTARTLSCRAQCANRERLYGPFGCAAFSAVGIPHGCMATEANRAHCHWQRRPWLLVSTARKGCSLRAALLGFRGVTDERNRTDGEFEGCEAFA
jgi:hypothetical protein